MAAVDSRYPTPLIAFTTFWSTHPRIQNVNFKLTLQNCVSDEFLDSSGRLLSGQSCCEPVLVFWCDCGTVQSKLPGTIPGPEHGTLTASVSVCDFRLPCLSSLAIRAYISRALIQHDEGHSPGVQFWKSLAHGFPDTNGKRGGLGSKCGRGRRPFPLINKKKPLPLSPWAFFPQGPFFCKCFKQHNRKLHLQVKH